MSPLLEHPLRAVYSILCRFSPKCVEKIHLLLSRSMHFGECCEEKWKATP